VRTRVCMCMCLQEQHDLLCVLLMIRLNAEHRTLMVARRVPCLDDYLDRVNLLLWPRFKVSVWVGGGGSARGGGCHEVGAGILGGWGGGTGTRDPSNQSHWEHVYTWTGSTCCCGHDSRYVCWWGGSREGARGGGKGVEVQQGFCIGKPKVGLYEHLVNLLLWFWGFVEMGVGVGSRRAAHGPTQLGMDDYLDRVNLLLWPRFKVCGGRGGQQWVGQEVGFFMRLGWGGGGEGPAHGTPATNPTRDDSQPPGTGLQ
jgi:hypothetical protein